MNLRVMTYNVLDGGEGREALIIEVLRAVQPDIIVLQEVFAARFVTDLGRALDMQPVFASGTTYRRVALLSRLPISAHNSYHPFPPIWRNVVEAQIELPNGRKLWVFGVHPQANLSIVFEVWRWREARYILGLVRPHLDEPCVIAGDFNAIAPGESVRIQTMPIWLKMLLYVQGNRVFHFAMRAYLDAGLTDCFRYCNPHAEGRTLPPPIPNARLDYIFVNEVLKSSLQRCFVVREPVAVNTASDHYPVVADFALQVVALHE